MNRYGLDLKGVIVLPLKNTRFKKKMFRNHVDFFKRILDMFFETLNSVIIKFVIVVKA